MARLRILTLNCWNVSPPYDGARRADPRRDRGARSRRDRAAGDHRPARRLRHGRGDPARPRLRAVFGAAFRWSEAGDNLPCHDDGDAFGNLIASRWPIERSDRPRCRESRPASAAAWSRRSSRRRPAGSRSSPRTSTGSCTTATSASVKQSRWPRWCGSGRARRPAADPQRRPERGAGRGGDPLPERPAVAGRWEHATCRTPGALAGDGGPGHTWDNANRFAAHCVRAQPADRLRVSSARRMRSGAASSSRRGWC